MKTPAAIQSFLYNRRSLNRRPRTIRWYEKNLNRFAAFYPNRLPTNPEAIEEFLARAVPDEKDETRHGYYRTLKALYRFTCKRHRSLNPMDLLDPPMRRKKVRPTLSSQEMNQLLQAPILRDRAALSLFIDNGARVGEVASLRKQNIFEDYIKVNGKSGEREIPISEETRRLLLSLASSNRTTDHVFIGQRGPLTTSGIYRLVQKYMRKANISGPKLGPHRIRHAFGKHYIKNGGDTRSLQKIMGHANITTTEIYVGLASEEIIAKHHQFTPLRSTHAAAQESFFDKDKAVKEAEEILAQKEANHGS
ncbi:hypothetical protein LCGC14_1664120 [marine sediment metagenome]|uniref:Tyr recombinase domain-containing protein n=1 Tax=marine sediment metagenome TaxID=412755 RepID=A0A0F9K933_9ZZZZ